MSIDLTMDEEVPLCRFQALDDLGRQVFDTRLLVASAREVMEMAFVVMCMVRLDQPGSVDCADWRIDIASPTGRALASFSFAHVARHGIGLIDAGR